MEKMRTTVKIAGREYSMTSYDTEEYVQRVATYVDRKMSELSLATRLPQQQLSVLVALNVADDMLKAHDENNRLKRENALLHEQLEALESELEQQKTKADAE